MGKPSKLRNPEAQPSRYEYENGSRKLYDRDKMPEGLDSEIWHLTLYFENVAESNGSTIPGRPIVYTELAHRLYTTGIPQVHQDYVPIIERMIDNYWNTNYDNPYSINDFCSKETFDYLLQWVLDTIAREELLSTGIRIKQHDNDNKPSKSTDKEQYIRKVTTGKYSEDELEGKLLEFRRNNGPGA